MVNPAWAPLVLDAVIVLLVVALALRGWRRGLLAGGLGLLGEIGGAALALSFWPQVQSWLAAQALGPGERTLVLVLLVFVGAAAGQAALGGLARRLRSHDNVVVHTGDRALGMTGSLIAAVLVLGALAAVIRPIAPAAWAETMDGSRAVTTSEALLPAPLRRAASGLGRIAKDTGFPRVFIAPTPEPTLPAHDPDSSITASAGVVAASASVVKVTSVGCGGEILGSGWVSSDERVVTNAHVVAGGTQFLVQVGGTGRPRRARLVAFNPDVDLAVLYIPGLTARALTTTSTLPDQSDVVVAGFPGGGSYTLLPGRVSGSLEAIGNNIYGQPGTTRTIYVLRAAVEHGDSGGPVLTRDGRVAGTVFARSLSDPGTGYALTDGQTSGFVDRAADDVAAVPSGACATN